MREVFDLVFVEDGCRFMSALRDANGYADPKSVTCRIVGSMVPVTSMVHCYLSVA